MPEENYDEENVINILAEQAELNVKYKQFFGDQSNGSPKKSITITNTNLSKKRTNHNQKECSRTKTT